MYINTFILIFRWKVLWLLKKKSTLHILGTLMSRFFKNRYYFSRLSNVTGSETTSIKTNIEIEDFYVNGFR